MSGVEHRPKYRRSRGGVVSWRPSRIVGKPTYPYQTEKGQAQSMGVPYRLVRQSNASFTEYIQSTTECTQKDGCWGTGNVIRLSMCSNGSLGDQGMSRMVLAIWPGKAGITPMRKSPIDAVREVGRDIVAMRSRETWMRHTCEGMCWVVGQKPATCEGSCAGGTNEWRNCLRTVGYADQWSKTPTASQQDGPAVSRRWTDVHSLQWCNGSGELYTGKPSVQFDRGTKEGTVAERPPPTPLSECCSGDDSEPSQRQAGPAEQWKDTDSTD